MQCGCYISCQALLHLLLLEYLQICEQTALIIITMFCIATLFGPLLMNCTSCSCHVLHCHIIWTSGAQGPTASGLLDFVLQCSLSTFSRSADKLQILYLPCSALQHHSWCLGAHSVGSARRPMALAVHNTPGQCISHTEDICRRRCVHGVPRGAGLRRPGQSQQHS